MKKLSKHNPSMYPKQIQLKHCKATPHLVWGLFMAVYLLQTLCYILIVKEFEKINIVYGSFNRMYKTLSLYY